MSDHWDRRFVFLAFKFAEWSKDPSTKVGCVVFGGDREIRSTGYNGLPRGVEDTYERLNVREQKYPLMVHAEENCVAHAARIGVSLKGCTAAVTFPPCSRCSRLLIQSGVDRVVIPAWVPVPDRWISDISLGNDMLQEAGVTLSTISLLEKVDFSEE